MKYKFSFNTISGAKHQSLNVDESLKYIEDVFFDYKRIAGVSKFYGRAAELGPGDNDGVALLFLAHGCTEVDLADRFFSNRNSIQQDRITSELKIKYPAINLHKAYREEALKRHYGPKSSGEEFFKRNNKYDFIFSRSVLEHVDDPSIVLNLMFEALNKGGTLIHKVDLRDHGMFTPYSDSTKFLEIHEKLYKMMVSNVGYPNRFLFHRYKEVLSTLNYAKCEFYIAGLHGTQEDLSFGYHAEDISNDVWEDSLMYINNRKSKFSFELKSVNAKYLCVSSFFFVVQK